MRAFGLLVLCCLGSGLVLGQAPPWLNVMPLPAHWQAEPGQLLIDPSFSIAITGAEDARLQRAGERFLGDLRRRTGMLPLDFSQTDGKSAKLVVRIEHPSQSVQQLGEDESYSLAVSPSGATLNAPNRLGAMHGLETFLQLLNTTSQGFAVPALHIEDKPRFPWRGLMIDVSRHFIPIEVLRRNLDAMAAVKLNVFHWHLSDDQGFRVESRKFPQLQEKGSDGLYYSQEEIRSLIAYAGERGIRVVPEFDMPGHTTAWFVGHPELASAPGPYTIERKWGIFDPAMNPAEERTYKFLNTFIGEMAKLFPDEFFHVGGDEVNGKQWAANAKIQAFMRSRGIRDSAGLQAYFTMRVQKIVSRHGRTMLGWDEILQTGFPDSVVIQSWRGQESLAQAAKLGYRGVLSAGYYLDLMHPAWQHYAVDPMAGGAAKLSLAEQQRILGGEACMWSEYASPENIDSRIWPRMAAIAERLWSPEDTTDTAALYQRMATLDPRLEELGVTANSSYAPMLRRIAGSDDTSSLRTLADLVEPVKDYTREETAPVEPTSLLPLNRLVDAARPESKSARTFAQLVDALVAGRADADAKDEIRRWLTRWRDQAAELRATEAHAFLLDEVMPLSERLAGIASGGLEAMDYLEGRQPVPAAWKSEQLALLEQAEKPQAQLLLTVVPSIRRLVELGSQPRSSQSK
jgi:hexosaminidase